MKRYFKKIYYFLFLFLAFYSSFAQDYTPIRKNWTYQFATTNNDTLITLKVDDAYLDKTDSVYELDKKYFGYRREPDGALMVNYDRNYDSTYSNILGRKIIKTANKDLLFITRNRDTLVLKPFAPLNSSWLFSTKKNIQATLFAKTYEDVLGIKDSVATFTLTNGKQIKIAKNLGLYYTSTAFEYENNTKDFNYINFDNFILEAIKGPGLGNIFPSIQNIYNYDIGDTWGQSHYRVIYINPNEYLYERVMYQIIDKEISNEIPEYKIKRIRREIRPQNKLIIDTITLDELKHKYQKGLDYYEEKLTYEVNANLYEPFEYIYSIFNDSMRFQTFNDFEARTYYTLYKGIGLYYYYGANWGEGYNSERIITDCFNNKNKAYGDCEDFLNKIVTNNKSYFIIDEFNITPNPTSSVITITTPEIGTFEILNNHGLPVLKGILNSSKQQIDLTNFSNGLYFIRITSKEHIIVKKILIEK